MKIITIDLRDHFDMIVGTSTGALIALGLVGGNVAEDGTTRIPMSVQEIIQMYRTETGRIFGKRDNDDCPTWASILIKIKELLGIQPDLNFSPYSQDGLVEVLDRKFGDQEMDDIALKNPDGSFKCIAAAVAREFKEREDALDELVIFDSRSATSPPVVDVLKASACAPVFFRGPSKIMNKNYVDGGVGGNCPLKQAVARMKELDKTDNTKIQLVVSIAPPKIVEPKKLEDLKSHEHVGFWLKHFTAQLTNGDPIYQKVRRKEKEALFHRVCPVSEKSRKFKMDEQNVDAMLEAVRQETVNDMKYFDHVLAIAASILLCSKKVAELNEDQALILFKLFSNHIWNKVEEEFIDNLSQVCHLFLTKLDSSSIVNDNVKRVLQEKIQSRRRFVDTHAKLTRMEFFKIHAKVVQSTKPEVVKDNHLYENRCRELIAQMACLKSQSRETRIFLEAAGMLVQLPFLRSIVEYCV